MSSRLSCRNASQARNDINARSLNKKTVRGGGDVKGEKFRVEMESV